MYRIFSACGILGYGFPESSLNNAMKQKLDLIACDAGSIDPGPYNLGSGTSFMSYENIKRDLKLLIDAAIKQDCPLVIGSCGLAGDTPNLNWTLNVAKDCFKELELTDIKVATIDSHINPEWVIDHLDDLTPVGNMPAPDTDAIKQSAIVAQAGIDPIITALKEGAQIILAGRTCDVALFAGPAIYNGIEPGLAFHAGHILECGAIACLPGSASDSLVAEIENNKVRMIAPADNRITTTTSIAAHSLYEEQSPVIQEYPEGCLLLDRSEYTQETPEIASFTNSRFVHKPLSIKLEGAYSVGQRVISLLPVTPESLDHISESVIVYGRNGVEERPVTEGEKEIGILVKSHAKDEKVAETLTAAFKTYFLHFGYEGRVTTAGNLAFPMSPTSRTFADGDGFTSIAVAGTREPYFIEKFETIKRDIFKQGETILPEMMAQGEVEVLVFDKNNPLLLLETVGNSQEEAINKHVNELKGYLDFSASGKKGIIGIHYGSLYQWSVFHVLHSPEFIKKHCFKTSLYHADRNTWTLEKQRYPEYEAIGEQDNQDSTAIITLNAITPVNIQGKEQTGSKPLIRMADVIRSKNAGIDTLCFDILFKTKMDYQIALNSNYFTKEHMQKYLEVDEKRMVNSFCYEDANAIKISVYRKKPSASFSERDVFGAQQQLRIEQMVIPVIQ